MFDFLKGKTTTISQPASVYETVEPKVAVLEAKAKTEQDIILEIHNSYDSATDEILVWANDILAKAATTDTAISERMSKLGFTSTSKVTENKELLKKKEEAIETAKLVDHYRMYYPNNKFITEEVVGKINKKYGLVCVRANQYKGDIPDKNLIEIEQFVMRDEDAVYAFYNHDKWNSEEHFLTIERLNMNLLIAEPWVRQNYERNKEKVIKDYQESFYISCPKKDTTIPNSRYSESGFAISEPKDPIVLKPVIGGFLIVTKWGLEGQDPALTNETMN